MGASVDEGRGAGGRLAVIKLHEANDILAVDWLVDELQLKLQRPHWRQQGPVLDLTRCCWSDLRVKAMSVDEKPTEDHSTAGFDKQIEELIEGGGASMKQADVQDLGSLSPKALMYGSARHGQDVACPGVRRSWGV